MRHQARALALVIVSLVTAITLAIASAFVSALAYGATALIVPGTGTPNADVVDGYRENAWSRYIDIACTFDCSEPDLVGIPYPASFWPVSFIPGWCVPSRCDKWNVSVGEGTENLLAALTPFLDPASDEDVYIFGYSQGGAVVANALTELGLLDLPDAVKERLKVVTIGGIENPDGGMWQRLAWLQRFFGNPLPILDVSFDPAMPVDLGFDTTSIGFEYDPVVYAPKYWGNALALLNMLAAFDTVHGYYLSPNENNENPMAYGYTDETLAPQLNCGLNPGNCRADSFGNTYITIPALSLPLTNLIRSLADSLHIGWLAKPFIDLAEPVLRELVDLGYDWSGNPGVPIRSSILPFKIFQNWLKVGIDLAVAAVKGVEAFVRNFIPGQTVADAQDSEESVTALAAPAGEDTAGQQASLVGHDAVVEEGTLVAEDTVVEEGTVAAEGTVVAEDTVSQDVTVVEEDTVVEEATVVEEDTVEDGAVVEEEPVVEEGTVEDETVVEDVTVVEDGAADEDDDSVAETADGDGADSDTDSDTQAAA